MDIGCSQGKQIINAKISLTRVVDKISGKYIKLSSQKS